jgi:Flp pilus assembly protein TadD
MNHSAKQRWMLKLAAIVATGSLSMGCSSISKSPLDTEDVRAQRAKRHEQVVAEFEARRDATQYQAALARIRCGDVDEARVILESVLKRNADYLPARLALAEILLEANQPEQALEHAQFVVERAPQEAAPRHVVGLILEAAGRTDEALAHFQQATDLEPANEVYRLSFQTTAEAIAGPQTPHNQTSPSGIESTLAAATEALQRGAPEESVRLLSAALATAPNDSRLLRALGLAHYRRGEYGEAQVVLAKAVSLDTTDPLSYFLLGATLRQMGQTAAADEQTAMAARLDPRYATWR